MEGVPTETGSDRVKLSKVLERSQPSCSLQHEFSLLNTNIPHIDLEVLDPIKRNATVRISVNGHIIMLQVLFPADYPNVVPEFTYCQGSTINVIMSETLMKVLKTCAIQRAKRGRFCLESCLRALVTSLKKVRKQQNFAFKYIFIFFRQKVAAISYTCLGWREL